VREAFARKIVADPAKAFEALGRLAPYLREELATKLLSHGRNEMERLHARLSSVIKESCSGAINSSRPWPRGRNGIPIQHTIIYCLGSIRNGRTESGGLVFCHGIGDQPEGIARLLHQDAAFHRQEFSRIKECLSEPRSNKCEAAFEQAGSMTGVMRTEALGSVASAIARRTIALIPGSASNASF
jgi:hypothetical protein